MKLDQETLLKKSILEVIALCIKLNDKNEELRTKVNNLNQVKASEDIRETNKKLRAENKALRNKLNTILGVAKIEAD